MGREEYRVAGEGTWDGRRWEEMGGDGRGCYEIVRDRIGWYLRATFWVF